MCGSQRWSFEARWDTGEFSEAVEVGEEVASYVRDIARVEASGGKARQIAITVEHVEEATSYISSNGARVEASGGKARQGAIRIEGVEEASLYRGDFARVEASGWETR